MQALFYNFAKRRNSTLTPSIPDGTQIDIDIKEESDVLSPTILLRSISRPGYNYVNVPALGRYYYITNERWKNGLWELRCKYDALATYKASIGITDHYILRSSAEFDGTICDNLYPATTDIRRTISSAGQAWFQNVTLDQGFYIVGLLGKWSIEDPQAGAITYIVMTASGFNDFCDQLFKANPNWYDPFDTGITESLAKLIYDPFQYVRSVLWVPDEPPYKTNGGTPIEVRSLRIGFWNLDLSGSESMYMLAEYPIKYNEFVSQMDDHPQAPMRGEYLNSSRFTTVNIYVPSVGLVYLPVDRFISKPPLIHNYIKIQLKKDYTTGDSRVDIYASATGQTPGEPFIDENSDILVKRVYGRFGFTVELSQAQSSINQYIGGMAGIAGTIMAPNPAVIAGTITSFSDIVAPPIDYTGSSSGFLDIDSHKVHIYTEHMMLTEDDNECNGRPLCKVRKPQDIPGFIKVEHCEVSNTRILPEELDEIKAYMEGGFFYE